MFIRKTIRFLKKILEYYSKIFTFIVLFLIYFLGIGITSLIGKLFNKDFLKIGNSKVKTSWHKYHSSNNMEKMY